MATAADIVQGGSQLTGQSAEAAFDSRLGQAGSSSGNQFDFDGDSLLPTGVNPGGSQVAAGPTAGIQFADGAIDARTVPKVTSDKVSSIVNGSPAQKAQWELNLAQAGIIDGSNGVSGYWTPQYTDKIVGLANFANSNGMTLEESLMVIAQQNAAARAGRAGRGGGGGRRVPAYQPPDPALLRQGVKNALREQLGRDPQTEELKILADELGQMYRKQYQAQVSGGTQVSPEARLQELIESRYEVELGLIEERQEFQGNMARGSQATGLVDRMISSGSQGGL